MQHSTQAQPVMYTDDPSLRSSKDRSGTPVFFANDIYFSAEKTANVENGTLSHGELTSGHSKDDERWIFDWITTLKEMSHQKLGSLSKTEFMAFKSDHQARTIREQLAECQTQTMTWKGIQSIAKDVQERSNVAKLRLSEISTNLEKHADHDIEFRKFTIRIWTNENKKLKQGNSIGHENVGERHGKRQNGTAEQKNENEEVEQQNEKLEQQEACLKEALIWEKRCAKRRLTKFVEDKVLELLKKQYNTLHRLEGKDKDWKDLPEDISSMLKVMKELYTGEDENFVIVGPVGERPLHVCSLLACNFANSEYVFEDQGNYMSDGIINAMNSFIKIDKYHDEMYVPYGKDYCAAIGALLWKKDKFPKKYQGLQGWMNKVGDMLPYIPELQKWYDKRNPDGPEPENAPVASSSHDKEMIVALGLYEGETILHPRMASRDEDTVEALLKIEQDVEEAKIREGVAVFDFHKKQGGGFKSLTSLKAYGLFFRPMYKECLTSASLAKTWHLYTFERLKRGNLHASSDKSHFGMSVLSFAASQGNVKIFDMIFRAIMRRMLLYLIQQAQQDEGTFLEPMVPSGQDWVDKGELQPGRALLECLNDRRGLEELETKAKKPKYILTKMSNVLLTMYLPKTYSAQPDVYEERHKAEGTINPSSVELVVADHGSDGEGLKQSIRKLSELQGKSLLVYVAALLREEGHLVRAMRRAILDAEDEHGNTVLHVAAWNGQKEMYDWLVKIGADQRKENIDNLSPFTLTARFGIWDMFKHIWDRHMTETIWKFGNVTAKSIDYSQFDWRTIGSYCHIKNIKKDINYFLDKYIDQYISKGESGSATKESGTAIDRLLEQKLQERFEERFTSSAARLLVLDHIENDSEGEEAGGGGGESNNKGGPKVESDAKCKPEDKEEKFSPADSTYMSAIRLITLFRPQGWFAHTKKLIERVVLHKWSQGYNLVYIGDIVLPYFVQVAIFSFMWSWRNLTILEHKFWWSDGLPIVADKPDYLVGNAEAACGWPSILNSYSGQLQLVMVLYGVPALLRLAWVQIRLRPTDLDENEDMVISLHEMINFIYLNLESFIDVIVAGLFLSILAGRIAAGEECEVGALGIEKASTAVASLFLFFNILVVLKAFRNLGLLLLSTYRFLMHEIFGILLMYCIFFAAFLLALHGLQRSEYTYLLWMQKTESIIPQIRKQQPWTYLSGENIPNISQQLFTTETELVGCDSVFVTITDTAVALLEVSMGDGFADTLLKARSFDFVCAGIHEDTLSGYIVVFWVFLTNVLILNLLIASMTYVFQRQMSEVDSVWLLDISYRVMKYEERFPELSERMQRPIRKYNFWTLIFYKRAFWDACLIIYCLPEWGLLPPFRKHIHQLGKRMYLHHRTDEDYIPQQVLEGWENYLKPFPKKNYGAESRRRTSIVNIVAGVEYTLTDDKLRGSPSNVEIQGKDELKRCKLMIYYLDTLNKAFVDSTRVLHTQRNQEEDESVL